MLESVRVAACFRSCVAFAFASVTGLAAASLPAQAPQSASIAEPKDAGIFYRVDASGGLSALEFNQVPKRFDLEIKGDRSPIRFVAGDGFRFAVKLPPNTEIAVVKPYVERGYRVVPRHFVNHKLVPEMTKGAELVQFETAALGSASTLVTLPRPLAPGEYCVGVAAGYDEYCFGVDPGEAAAGVAPVAGAPAGAGTAMTNADVIKLVNAGLPSDVVVSSISRAPARNFDLSVDGLLALKGAKVPDVVIQTMARSGDAAPAPTSPAPGGGPSGPGAPAPVPDSSIQQPTETGVFYVVGPGGRLRKMESIRASVTKIERDMFEGNQVSFKLYGAHSPVRVQDGGVALVVKLIPKDNKFHILGDYDTHDLSKMYFRRFESIEGSRQTLISAENRNRFEKHTPDPGEFEFTITKLGADFYKVTANDPLIPGEYCVSPSLFSAILPIDCFGVDGPR